jgi:hypothetical protein
VRLLSQARAFDPAGRRQDSADPDAELLREVI